MSDVTNHHGDFRDNPEAIAGFLTKAFATNDLEQIVAALSAVIRAQNVLTIAETAGLRGEGLYRTFSDNGDPRIGRLIKLFEALDVNSLSKHFLPNQSLLDQREALPFDQNLYCRII